MEIGLFSNIIFAFVTLSPAKDPDFSVASLPQNCRCKKVFWAIAITLPEKNPGPAPDCPESVVL
jgi:hypothetical protein